MYQKTNHTHTSVGYLLVLVLVFGSVFLGIVSSFVGFIIGQNQVVNFRYEQQRATDIAEAGLNYYRWRLAHYPDDVTDGTGTPGPYVHVYDDPEGGAIGEFSLSIASSTYCGDVASIVVTATGHTYDDPDAVAVLSARYTRPTVAEYSFVTNGGVWYGDDRVITGPVHSNQGIRMDGYHNSWVGSGQSTWTCDDTYGCSPSQVVDGVYTTSGNATPSLFVFPVSAITFGNMTLDLNAMKDRAQNGGGIYYAQTGGHGYHVTFNGDGTVDVYRVNGTQAYWAYSVAEGWHTSEHNVITSSSFIATETINPECPLLFFEDKVWLDGDVSEKVALAAADLSSNGETNIVINDNVQYVPGANAGLLAIAETDIDIGLVVPENMEVDGIYIAKDGRFGRNHYSTAYLSWSLDPYVIRGTLTRFGSVISNGRVGTQWVDGIGNTVSGFQNRVTSFDQDQVDDPPPLTPVTSDVYEFKDWQQGG